jgi:hypothetical protein
MYRVEILQTAGSRQGLYAPGRTPFLPALGRRMHIFDDDGLVLKTAQIIEAEEHAGGFFFKTANSSYLLKILEYVQISGASSIKSM